MTTTAKKSTVPVQALRQATLTEEPSRELYKQGEEAIVFALLELTKQLAQARPPSVTPSTPSGMVPVYKKATKKGKRGKKPGAKKGHPGSRRPRPERIDWEVDHRADCCPDCGGRLKWCEETRKRYTQEFPDMQPEVTEHTIHRDWCPRCRKKVEPPVTDALPGSTLGLRVLVFSAWLHYALGNPLSQIVEVFNFHMQLKISEGGLVQMWYRLQEVLFAWYENIRQEALESAVLHGDETGWGTDSETNWLWCFTTRFLTFYMIDRAAVLPWKSSSSKSSRGR